MTMIARTAFEGTEIAAIPIGVQGWITLLTFVNNTVAAGCGYRAKPVTVA